MTDADLCHLIAASYTTPPTATVAGDIRLVITGDVMCIPGTRETVADDWLRDLDVKIITDPVLGDCHEGCLSAADAVMAWLIATHRSTAWPRIIAGHSLGGGIASLVGAMFVLAGQPLDRLMTVGSMRSCRGEPVPRTLAPVQGDHYVHAGDPVPDLPPTFDHWRTPTVIGQADRWPISNHLMTAYLPALEQIP